MRRFCLIVLLAVIAIQFISCLPEDFTPDNRIAKTRYFASYNLNAWYEIEGRYEFDPDSVARSDYYQFNYDDSDRVIGVQFYYGGKFGYRVGSLGMSEVIIEYTQNEEIRRFYNYDRHPVKGWDKAFEIRIKKDTVNHRGQIIYCNHDGSPIRIEGVIKHILGLDEKGRIVRDVSISTLEDSVHNKNWVCEERYAYDKSDNKILVKKVDFEGNVKAIDPLPYDQQIYNFRFSSFDSVGNKISTYFARWEYPIDETLPDSLYHMEYIYNDWGQIIESRYYNEEYNNYLGSKNGIMTFDTVFTSGTYYNVYDSSGNKIRVYERDESGSIKPEPPGYSIIEYSHDEYGNVIECRFCDSLGNMHIWEQNEYDKYAARVEYKYDDLGMIIEDRYYDTLGNLWAGQRGYAVGKYKSGKYYATEQYFDENENPCYVLGDSVAAGAEIIFDEWGNVLEVSMCDQNGNTVNSGRSKYNSRGLMSEKSNYNGEGELDSSATPPLAKYRYDENDYCIEELYFGVDYKPLNIYNGIARIEMVRDQYGDTVSVKYYNADNVEVVKDRDGWTYYPVGQPPDSSK